VQAELGIAHHGGSVTWIGVAPGERSTSLSSWSSSTGTSRCTRFLAVFGSGTRWKYSRGAAGVRIGGRDGAGQEETLAVGHVLGFGNGPLRQQAAHKMV
jgi:hypothetical protein